MGASKLRLLFLRLLGKKKASLGIEQRFMNLNACYASFDVGDYTYGSPTILFADSGENLKIGRYVSIADDVVIMLGGEHRLDWATTYPFSELFDEWKSIEGHPASKGSVHIGHDVWVGRNVLILSGVNIGDGAVIAAGSVVTKDVAPYSVVGGNPAKHIKYRFDVGEREALLGLTWWNWPLEDVRKATPYLLSSDIGSLVEYYEQKIKDAQ